MVDELKWARDAALQTVSWVKGFDFPDFERDYEYVALRHPEEYPLMEGRLVSNKGLDIAKDEYEDNFVEEHVAHSNALHSHRRGHGAYHVGPLARYSLNFDRLPPLAREAARDAGLGPQCFNPFQSIVVRAVELVFACDEALRIIDAYEEPATARARGAGPGRHGSRLHRGAPGPALPPLSARCGGADSGSRIVPPTSQNQKTIEDDLWKLVPEQMDLDQDALTRRCEQAIRNYDPCISCATHFLKLDLVRDPACPSA